MSARSTRRKRLARKRRLYGAPSGRLNKLETPAQVLRRELRPWTWRSPNDAAIAFNEALQ